jgi:hypothetical protein
MISSIIRALAGISGVLRVDHLGSDGSRTVVEYVSTDAMRIATRALPVRHGNESSTAKYMLIATPEQKVERYRKIMSDAKADNERLREYGSWAGGWS